MISLEPVACQHGEVSSRSRERNGNLRTAPDSDATKPSGGFVELEGRKVEKATNLILDLDIVSEVPPRRDWAGCSKNSVLPWVPSLLYAIPTEESQDMRVGLKLTCGTSTVTIKMQLDIIDKFNICKFRRGYFTVQKFEQF